MSEQASAAPDNYGGSGGFAGKQSAPEASAARLTAIAELQERLNVFASDGCTGPYDEPCWQAREDMPMEWCPHCAAQEASKLLAQIVTLRQEQARLEAEATQHMIDYQAATHDYYVMKQDRDAALAALDVISTNYERLARRHPEDADAVLKLAAALHPDTGRAKEQ